MESSFPFHSLIITDLATEVYQMMPQQQTLFVYPPWLYYHWNMQYEERDTQHLAEMHISQILSVTKGHLDFTPEEFQHFLFPHLFSDIEIEQMFSKYILANPKLEAVETLECHLWN